MYLFVKAFLETHELLKTGIQLTLNAWLLTNASQFVGFVIKLCQLWQVVHG